MIKQRVITIVGTSDTKLGVAENKELGMYEVIPKEEVMGRIEDILEEGWGYSIVISEPKYEEE